MLPKPLNIAQINSEISLLSEDQLMEVKQFVESLAKTKSNQKTLVNLKGIWAGKGFEDIANMEEELAGIQKKIADILLKKEL